MAGPEECPVCLIQVEGGRDRDYGDKKQVKCPRCGPFEISRTALAMLESRVSTDTLARARLSHAIRLNTSEPHQLFISSANLDELVQQRLPGVPQQVEHLVRWLAAQLGEDRFGCIPEPWPETLAGIVGAADGNRVRRLIDYAVKKGLVDRDDDADALGLSPDGWHLTEPQKKEEEPDKREAAAPAPEAMIVKAHCNTCGGERNAFKRTSHTVHDGDNDTQWANTYDILECCGCRSVSVRHEFWFSEWDGFDFDPITGDPRRVPGVKVAYWPPPTKRAKPAWADNLDDDVLRGLFDEVYQALTSGLIVLATIGARTLLDRAMFLRIGDPRGGFVGKLDRMVERGNIGKDEKYTLQAMTDAGSASAHRGFAPNANTLSIIIDTVENFMHREFVLKTAAGEVRAETPPRIE